MALKITSFYEVESPLQVRAIALKLSAQLRALTSRWASKVRALTSITLHLHHHIE